MQTNSFGILELFDSSASQLDEYGLLHMKDTLAKFAAAIDGGDTRCGCKLPCVRNVAKVVPVDTVPVFDDQGFVYFQVMYQFSRTI